MQNSLITGLFPALVLSALLGGPSPLVFGGAVTDGSVGPARTFSGSGDSFTVPEAAGTLKGSNLFHSFTRFSVDPGESAKFTTATDSIRNVISRVTGGEPSVIHGWLALEAASGSHPDFYFVNPAGVVFGAGARVNVPAGLHMSTAQQLKFVDGFVWNTTAPTMSALTVAAPEAFGFVGPSAAPVTFHNRDAGGIAGAGPKIQLAPNSTLSISGGAVQFDSADASVSEGGQISMTAHGEVSILNGSLIFSGTSSDQAAGSIHVEADSMFVSRGQSREATGIQSQTKGTGDAGRVTIKVTRQLSILGGEISSETDSAGSAGLMDIEAGAMTINGLEAVRGIFNDAGQHSVGASNAGRVRVKVAGALALLDGGQISSSSISRKAAGSVDVEAGTLMIDARKKRRATGIFSATGPTPGAVAGRVSINVADTLSILNGAEISSNSLSEAAGTIDVRARSLTISGFRIRPDRPDLGLLRSRITSVARPGSSGQPGSVSIATDRLEVMDRGGISIENESTLPRLGGVALANLAISAGSILLSGGSRVTAASSGTAPASSIEIGFTELLMLRDAAITTEAIDGNGGKITIRGGRGIALDQSQVTTSVSGTRNGNGGDITINASVLALNTGFVQANTRAILATGGNVFVNVDALLPSGSTLALGGDELTFRPEVFALNIIQAAAPDGVSGRVHVAVPALDIAGNLAGLQTNMIDLAALGRDFCRVGASSSLTPVGRGGLRPTASALTRPEGGYGLTVVGNEDGIGRRSSEIADPTGVQLAKACY